VATFDDGRAFAIALPEAEEIETWETDITFRVRKRNFAVGGQGGDSVSFKAPAAMQADPINRDPRTFRPSASVGRFGLVTADLRRIDDDPPRTLLPRRGGRRPRNAWRAARWRFDGPSFGGS